MPVWLGFNAFVIALLLIDVFNRRSHQVAIGEALGLVLAFTGGKLLAAERLHAATWRSLVVILA